MVYYSRLYGIEFGVHYYPTPRVPGVSKVATMHEKSESAWFIIFLLKMMILHTGTFDQNYYPSIIPKIHEKFKIQYDWCSDLKKLNYWQFLYTFFFAFCRNMPLLGWMNYEVQIYYKMKIWNEFGLKVPLHCVLAAQYYKKLQTITHLVYFEHIFHHKKRSKIRNWKIFSRLSRVSGKKKSCTWNVIKLWKYYIKEKIIGKKSWPVQKNQQSLTKLTFFFTNFTNLSEW